MNLPSPSPAKDAALRDAGLLLLRATPGTGLPAHGLYFKVMVFGIPNTMGLFAQIGYPGWLGAAVALGETRVGFLLAGVWTRLAAIAMVPVLAGATLQSLPPPSIGSGRRPPAPRCPPSSCPRPSRGPGRRRFTSASSPPLDRASFRR